MIRTAIRYSGWLIGIISWLALRVAAQNPVLQPLSDKPVPAKQVNLTSADYYVPATVDTVRWGYLPNNEAKPIFTVPSGAVVTFDSLSPEGVLEDQGRDPVKFFGSHGAPPDQVLNDAKAIAGSALIHDFVKDGPHVVIGPLAVEEAQPGDVLKVEMISMVPRVPYGVISNRHGKGELPGEFPETPPPQPDA